ncbi:MAG: hypothetical protein LLF96_12150 [Eubacteriales bacterium]|nr:hypothetical protein [Eubacteriales bacterium]
MNWFLTAVSLACVVGMVLFYYLMELSKKSPKKLLSKDKEFKMPDVRFHYTTAELYAIFAEAGEEGRPQMRRYWLIDFGLIVCFWGVMIAIGLNLVGQSTALFLYMGIVATVRAGVDFLEDGLLLWLLRAYPAQKNNAAHLAGAVTSLKFVCLYTWVGLLFVKLVASAFKITL